MNRKNPPRIAAWMMERLTPSDSDEAIGGDLLEDFCAGRSARWYRRQVIAAIAMEWGRGLWHQRSVLLFAAIWSLLSPTWLDAVSRFYRHNPFMGYIWRIPWPWSTVCDFALRVAVDMFFIWVGVLAYVLLCRIAFGKLDLRRPLMAVLASIIAFALGALGLIAAGIYATAHFHGRSVDGTTLTSAFTIWTLFVCLQHFGATVVALWFLSPKPKALAQLAA